MKKRFARYALYIIFPAVLSCSPAQPRETVENGIDVSPFETFEGQTLSSQRFAGFGWPKIPNCRLNFHKNGKLTVIIFRQLASNKQERLSFELKYNFTKNYLVVSDITDRPFKTIEDKGKKYIFIKTLAVLETKSDKPKEEIECKLGFDNQSYVIVINTYTLLDFKRI